MRFCSLFAFVLSLSLAAPVAAQIPMAGQSDIRVLIDVSGSMKHTDPHNLRQPATELLLRLLPTDARAGVWTFGTQVDPLIPHGVVNEAWRKQGLSRVARIGSTDMHTDVPAALERAVLGASANAETSVILLTDGVVDVSTAADENAAARHRVLQELAPQLRAVGVRVHTVALSEQADHELMEQLSLATDGFHAIAASAADLQKLFLQALDTAAPAEQLPLEGNQFLVDGSIDELTTLVFHHGAPLVLHTPDGSSHQGARHGDNFRWFAGDGFELITVTAPQAGLWRLDADTETGSRVTIVSNLSLTTSRLIQNGFPDQPQSIEAQLREQDAPLQQPELLALVNVSAQVVRLDDDYRWDVPLLADAAKNASYAAALPMLVAPGRYEVTVVADGKTFRRSWVQRVRVRDHLALHVGKTTAEPFAHRISIDVVNPAIELAASELRVAGAGVATPTRTATGWELLIPMDAQRREIDMAVAAVREDGTQLEIPLDHMILEGEALVRAARVAAPETVDAGAEESAVEVVAGAAEPAEAGMGWKQYSLLGIANLLLAGLAWIVIRTVRKSGRPTVRDDGGEPGETPASAAAQGNGSAPTAGAVAGQVFGPEVGSGGESASVAQQRVLDDLTLDDLNLADLDLPLDAIDLDPEDGQR